VDGKGSIFVTPDVADVGLSVALTAPTPQAARGRVNARSQTLLNAVERVGVPPADIKTTVAGIQRQTMVNRRTHHRHVVYRAENGFAVHITNVALVPRVIDTATAAQATDVQGPDFSFSRPSAGMIAATRAALADARARADDAAAAEGDRVSGVQSIVVNPETSSGGGGFGSTPIPLPPARGKRPRPQTPVLPGRQEVDATVRVTFSLTSG
jgi:uncharacterized protein YggE